MKAKNLRLAHALNQCAVLEKANLPRRSESKKASDIRSAHKYRAKRKGLTLLGSHSKAEWLARCAEYDNRCAYCRQDRKLTRDHIIAITKGGTNYITNIVPACRQCNASKGDREAPHPLTYERSAREAVVALTHTSLPTQDFLDPDKASGSRAVNPYLVERYGEKFALDIAREQEEFQKAHAARIFSSPIAPSGCATYCERYGHHVFATAESEKCLGCGKVFSGRNTPSVSSDDHLGAVEK